MAVYNLFLGSATRSLGDVTLLRRAGRQIARVRLRTIGNPRTEAQAEQRNFVAPVSRFYGQLRTELRRSFQGLSRDASYNAFQRANVRLARTNGWYLPKATQFFPLPYQLSQGSILPFTYALEAYENYTRLRFANLSQTIQNPTQGDVSRALIGASYHEGDVITFIWVLLTEDGSYVPGTSQMVLNSQSIASLSSLDGQGVLFRNSGANIVIQPLSDELVAGSVIVSRYHDGRWLRSTQFLTVIPSIVATLTSEAQRQAALYSYMQGGSDSGGGVYPGGSGQSFNVAAADGRALLFIGGQYSARVVSLTDTDVVQLRPANIEAWFYVRVSSTRYLRTTSRGSLDPAAWAWNNLTIADATSSNTIVVTDGDAMAQYLATIGVALP